MVDQMKKLTGAYVKSLDADDRKLLTDKLLSIILPAVDEVNNSVQKNKKERIQVW